MTQPTTITFTKDTKYKKHLASILVTDKKGKKCRNITPNLYDKTLFLTSKLEIHFSENKNTLCLKTSHIANPDFVYEFFHSNEQDKSLKRRNCSRCQITYWDRISNRESALHISNHNNDKDDPNSNYDKEPDIQLFHNNLTMSSLTLQTSTEKPIQQFQLYNNTDSTIKLIILETENHSGHITINTTTTFCEQRKGWNNLLGSNNIEIPSGSTSRLKIEISGEPDSIASTYFQIRCEYLLNDRRKGVHFPVTVLHNNPNLEFDCSSEPRIAEYWTTATRESSVNETRATNRKSFLHQVKSDRNMDYMYDKAENYFNMEKHFRDKPQHKGTLSEGVAKILKETPKETTRENCSTKWTHLSNLERRHQVNSRTVIQGIARNNEETNFNQTILVDIGIEKILTSRIRKGDGVVVDHQGIQTHGEITEIGSTVTKITVERPLSFSHPSKITISADINYHTYRVQATIAEQLRELDRGSMNYIFPTGQQNCDDSDSDDIEIDDDTQHITYYQNLNDEQKQGTKDILNHNGNTSILVTGVTGSAG